MKKFWAEFKAFIAKGNVVDLAIAVIIGAAFNKSCYNGYEHDFSICNIELKYTYSLKFKNDFTLPLSVAYITNPVYEKSHVNFIMNFAF